MVLKIILFVILPLLYTLPSLIAYSRRHRHFPYILLLNIFLGWTIILWIATLLWSILTQVPHSNRKRKTRRAVLACLIVMLLSVGSAFLIGQSLSNLFEPERSMVWKTSTGWGYLIQPYPLAEIHSDIEAGAESSLVINCRNGFLGMGMGTNLHGMLPGDAMDKSVKARHRIGQGAWTDMDWTVKRLGPTYPNTDFSAFIESWNQEDARLIVEFETGTTVHFPVGNGYTEMREHITCIE